MVLVSYTHGGYAITMQEVTWKAAQALLPRIEGQVGGLLRMVQEDRYCMDALTQVNAVRTVLYKVLHPAT